MNFEVLIIGSDANAYYMARCVYELYNKKVHLIASKPMSFVTHSNIINATYDSRLWDIKKFALALNEYVKTIQADKIICISSNETYARGLVANKEKLDKRILFNYVDLPFLDSLMMKDKFYETYKDSGLLPKTIIYNLNDKLKIDGILLTRYSPRAILSREVAEIANDLAQNLNTKVFKSTIREAIAVKESQINKQSLFDYAPNSNVTNDYLNFINELLKGE